MAADLAQEELQRVGRRVGRRLDRRCRLRRALDDLDAAGLELVLQGVELERAERVQLHELVELALAHGAGLLRRGQQVLDRIVREDGLWGDRHPRRDPFAFVSESNTVASRCEPPRGASSSSVPC